MKRASLIAACVALLLAGQSRPAAADEVSLIFTPLTPPDYVSAVRVFAPWADHINQTAKGVLHIDIRYGIALANSFNIFDRVKSDVMQVAVGIPSLVGGKFPLSDVVTMPFVTEDGEKASIAFWRLYKTGLLDAEYKEFIPLATGLFLPQGVHTNKVPASLDDLKGLRLRVASKTSSEVIERLGGAPVALDPQEVYASIQRGLIDGVVLSWAGMGPLKLLDVTSYHVETELGTVAFVMFMSRAKYESLSEDARRVIDANSGEGLSAQLGATFDQQSRDARAPAAAASDKHKIVQLTPAQEKIWRDKLAPVIDGWTAAHPGGAKLLETYRKILADLKTGH